MGSLLKRVVPGQQGMQAAPRPHPGAKDGVASNRVGVQLREKKKMPARTPMNRGAYS